MRISDCSSDVCSSYRVVARNTEDGGKNDVHGDREDDHLQDDPDRAEKRAPIVLDNVEPPERHPHARFGQRCSDKARQPACVTDHDLLLSDRLCFNSNAPLRPDGRAASHRSEEHTSELQSLMRISYAVFCLKKKKKK